MKDTDHYKILDGLQYKDVIEALMDVHQNDSYVDHNRYQSMKYLWRLGQKDSVLKELFKARAYIDYAIERQQKIEESV